MTPVTHHRGAALLIVLAVLVVVGTTAVIVVERAGTVALRRDLAAHEAMAVDLVFAADAPIRHWLASVAPTVVLPPDAAEPSAPVLFDAWILKGHRCEIRITAWDQCGMVDIETARSGNALRQTLPARVRRIVSHQRVPNGTAAGMDLFERRLREGDDIVPYPAPEHVEPARFGDLAGEAEPGTDGDERDRPVALGALLATHQRSCLNVNTAPLALVAAALRRSGRGGLEQIVAARSAGEKAGVAVPLEQDRRDATRLVSTSMAWSFRVDTRVGGIQRSWWETWTRTEGAGSAWERVQRLAVDD